MTKEELIEGLKKCTLSGDPEDHHLVADQLLVDFICDVLGDRDVQEAFDNIEKWYA